jgi:archaellum component FlaG (FlaF/FlaG flagellin family)
MTSTRSELVHLAANLLLAAATVLLAWDTRRMASSTERMTQLTAKMMNVEQRPYLYCQTLMYNQIGPTTSNNTGAVQIGLVMRNPGKVIAEYAITDIALTLDGRTVERPSFINRGTRVFPSDAGVFWMPPIDRVDNPGGPKQGTLDLTLSYWTPGETNQYPYDYRMNYVLEGGDVRWVELPK